MVSDRGTVSALAQRLAWGDRYQAGSQKGAICMCGHTYDRDGWFGFDVIGGEMRDISARLPLGCVGTGTTWGNSSCRTLMSSLKTNAQVSLFAAGKVHLMGVSAGGTACLNWAKNNPTLVQSISLIIPCLDIQAINSEDRGSFASSVQTAYGGAPSDAENPADNPSSFRSFPIKIWYSTTDTLTTTSEVTTFASAVGSNVTTVSMGALGHLWTQPGLGVDVGNFMKEND